MNSKKKLHKLAKPKHHRKAVLKNLLDSLVIFEHVKTTKAKAKAVIPQFEKAINTAKKNEVKHAKKLLNKIMFNENAVDKVIEVFKKRFAKENGGYIKIFNLGPRKGDSAEMSMLIVKGYEYKDVGKKVKQKEDKKEAEAKAEPKQPKLQAERNLELNSQVKGKVEQARSNTRSGI